ncbi:MAG: type IV pilus assembly protein PilM [Planctomycetota bacterium]|jgi:type IV pilus assembly protein PilM
MAKNMGLGIDIGAATVKAVRLERRGAGLQVTGAVKLTTADVPEEQYNIDPEVAGELAQHLAGAGIRTKKAAVGVSGKDLIMRYVEVPPVPQWRLKMIMDFEIGEMAGRAGGDVTSDFRLLDLAPNEAGNLIVLVALAKNAYLDRRIEVLNRVRIGAYDLLPSSLALHKAFQIQGTPPPGETTLVVDVGARNTEMVIQRDGVLLFARNVSSGGNLFTAAVSEALRVPLPEAEKIKCKHGAVTKTAILKATNIDTEAVYESLSGVASQFTALIRSSVQFCKSQTKLKNLTLDRILLSGGGSRLRGMKDHLASAFRIPVEVLQPFGDLTVMVDDPEQAERITESPREMSIALGLALSAMEDEDTLRLLPERFQRRRDLVEKKIFLFGAGAAAAVFLGLGIVTGTHNRATADTYSQLVNTEFSKADNLNESILSIKDEMIRTERVIDFIHAESASPARFLRVQGWLQKNLPDEIWVREVLFQREVDGTIMTGDAKVVVRGVVENTVQDAQGALVQFVRKLKNALIEDVADVKMEMPRQRGVGHLFTFDVKLMPEREPEEGEGEGEDEEEGSGGRRRH